MAEPLAEPLGEELLDCEPLEIEPEPLMLPLAAGSDGALEGGTEELLLEERLESKAGLLPVVPLLL